ASTTRSSSRARSPRTHSSTPSSAPRSRTSAPTAHDLAAQTPLAYSFELAEDFGSDSDGKSRPKGTLAQLGERRVHTAEVTGSIPVRPTIRSARRLAGPVAQLDRALASGARGRRFESCLGRHRLARRRSDTAARCSDMTAPDHDLPPRARAAPPPDRER